MTMYQKTDLANQLRVATHTMKERESVAIGLWVGSGGRYEDDKVKGAAHFLEHILFKGSAEYSCDEIKEKIEGVGGSLNAFTGEEQTCYYAKIPAPHMEQTFDILADMVFFPKIMKRDVEKERTVIIEEIKMYHDLPQYFVMELLDELMWPGHPLGKNLAGTPETVGNISHQDLRHFHRRHYVPANVVVAACGQVRHEDFLGLAKKKLSSVAVGSSAHFLKADHSQARPKVKFAHRDIEQMHLALGMLGLADDHPDKYVLGLLHVILGGNMSSRLFDVVREKKGLAYSIATSMKTLRDTGMFMVRAGVDNTKIVEAVDIILKELKRIKRSSVPAGELKRARDYYSGQVMLGLEDTLDHMLWIGESVITRDKFRTLKDVVGLINKVTAADIHRMANEILVENHFNLSLVGPIKDSQEKDLSTLLNVPV